MHLKLLSQMFKLAKVVFFSFLLTFFLVQSIRGLEFVVNSAVKATAKVSLSEYEFQEPACLMDDGIRVRAVTQNSLRFSAKNQAYGFGGLLAIFVALFFAFSKNFFLPVVYSNNFFGISYFPKYLLFHQILV